MKWLEIWSVCGASVMLLAMALLKRRWNVADRRFTSDKTLRKTAKLYYDAHCEQEKFWEQVAIDFLNACEKRGENPQFFDFTILQLEGRIERRPDFLKDAKEKQAADIDNLPVPKCDDKDDEDK